MSRRLLTALFMLLATLAWGACGCNKPTQPDPATAQAVNGPGQPVPYETNFGLQDPKSGQWLYFATETDARLYQARMTQAGN
ncbi:MAG: hypothetical protein BIFFINMI_01408 [Phycisphaerae bacterium]|nr:hypothetical protein [Phycisphaerae bacterium]